MTIYKMTYFTAFMIPLDEEFKNLRRKENILVGLIPNATFSYKGIEQLIAHT